MPNPSNEDALAAIAKPSPTPATRWVTTSHWLWTALPPEFFKDGKYDLAGEGKVFAPDSPTTWPV